MENFKNVVPIAREVPIVEDLPKKSLRSAPPHATASGTTRYPGSLGRGQFHHAHLQCSNARVHAITI